MGQCRALCKGQSNQKFCILQSKSQNEWVRKMNIDNVNKQIIEPQTQKSPQKYYYYMHDPNIYTRGLIFANNTFYQGELDQNHMAKGYGEEKILCQAGQSIYKGYFNNNTKNGLGQYYDNNLKFKGEWKNGFPIKGELQLKKLSIKNQKIKYIINYLKFHNYQMTTGYGIIVMPEGSVYQGQFVKNIYDQFVIEGVGNLRLNNSDLYNGEFKDGKFHGQVCTYTWSKEGKKFVGQYKNGLKDGIGKFYITKTKYIEGGWVQGKKQGKFLIYQEKLNGNKKLVEQISYKDDKSLNSS